ncbi:MAG: glutamine-hydrolyzing GMP synthase, partial [Bdellovibrionaceae bacterium]|nr:glutamine-hydrolyzing GMP synthase [Pseudobdellovibrionaceae bacterium]
MQQQHSGWDQQVEGGFVVLDFGSQLTQLIARRLRELGVFSELLPFDTKIEEIKKRKPSGIILSGGPSSVHEDGSPRADVKALGAIAPLLGICYGMQLIAQELGGKVVSSNDKEYGSCMVDWLKPLSPKIPVRSKVWMSHGDVVMVPPPGFKIAAKSETGHMAAMQSDRAWAVQFHPEVMHTDHGIEILREFAFTLCKAKINWNPGSIVEHLITGIRDRVGLTDHVLCGLSGGVDSSVVAALLTKALGADRVHCVFVNNGLLRKGEYDGVLE